MKITPLLMTVLVLSISANIFFLTLYVPSDQNKLSQLNLQLNAVSNENTRLHSEIDQVTSGLLSPEEMVSIASLQAPAVSQSVQNEGSRGSVARTVVQRGSIMNISVEIGPGKGRVMVQTRPLMGVVFQSAANTAVAVAGNKTGFDLSKSDVIFSIDAGDKISEVDGPSAGALMTLLTISAIEKQHINGSMTLTGTINNDGHIGAIGGVVAKASAAKGRGKTMILIPADNKLITPPSAGNAGTGIFTFSQSSQQQVSAKDYIEKNIGINVTYVDTIEDIITESMDPVLSGK
jgi:predicted S18 family serine protease